MNPRWDNYRYFLMIARSGSVAGAAAKLGESIPTVSRRLAELEQALGRQLFQRRSTGVELTRHGHGILQHAERAELALLGAPFAVGQDDEEPRGRVRLTAPVALGRTLVAPALGGLMQQYVHLEVELLLESRKLSLPNYEADLALRMGAPVHASLIGRKVGQVTFGIFAHRDYLAAAAETGAFDPNASHTVVSLRKVSRPYPQSTALFAVIPNRAREIATDDLSTQVELVASGVGIAALPRYLASRREDLTEITIDGFSLEIDLWLLAREDMRKDKKTSVTHAHLLSSIRSQLR
ncbi:MAG: LysR family transcriptional regulator [Pseudomonadota bacterium]